MRWEGGEGEEMGGQEGRAIGEGGEGDEMGGRGG